MLRRTKLHLNHIEQYNSPTVFEGLTYVLRTDADHATRRLKDRLSAHFNTAANPAIQSLIRQKTHKAYRVWGHQVLRAMAANLDYARYDIENPQNRFLNVHFYNARDLAKKAVEKGYALARAPHTDTVHHNPAPVFFISLDDMIQKQAPLWGELAFSRQFDPETSLYSNYQGRPGKRPLPEQLETLARLAAGFRKQHGRKLPVILLEDNVRHAKMVNMVLGMLEESGMTDHVEIAGISTCFCCADDAERAQIRMSDGRVVPVTTVIDYGTAKIDVATPRDLLFDGYAVNLDGPDTNMAEGRGGRLPAVFMDAASLFKIRPERAEVFNRKVLDANIGFCKTIERNFKVDLTLSWFRGAEAISTLRGHDPDTRMVDVLRSNDYWRRAAINTITL